MVLGVFVVTAFGEGGQTEDGVEEGCVGGGLSGFKGLVGFWVRGSVKGEGVLISARWIYVEFLGFGEVVEIGQRAFALGALERMTEHSVIIIDFVQCFIEFLVLTLNILVEISKLNRLEVVDNIQINLGLLLVLKIIIILGDVVLAGDELLRPVGLVGVEEVVALVLELHARVCGVEGVVVADHFLVEGVAGIVRGLAGFRKWL